MYELVNTSVPNGLIAGTHGFATVSMTKGMPDAIRTRVESFCAYPHRTSAHDQSYFRDNPVNWFHLQIPSGDHVVGRTAPAEFDYTGRTNRLAHTLVFGAKEMPIVGGAYVLGAESRRFLAAWSGEPKYLPVDKQTAGRLGLADVPRNASPSNWTSVFGEDGAKYARRFATLVAKNVSGGNKSVYFKTSTSWDSDGTRLLGLFSDLINLLPEGIRPFVTFSTFAACVPNGVACHLRGIYDKDRAFEIASATQPWVDCEHGRIVHEELLPEEDNCMGGVRDHGQISENYEGKVQSGIQRGYNTQHPQNAQQRIIDYLNGKTAQQEKFTFPWWIVVAMLVAALVFVCAIVGPDNIVRRFKGSVTKEVGGSDNNRIKPDNSSIIEQNDDAKKNSQGAEDSKPNGENQDKVLLDREKERKERETLAKKQADQAEASAKAKADAEVNERIAEEKAKREEAAAAEKKAMADERAEWPRKIDVENVLFDKTLDDVVLEDGGMKFKRDYVGMTLTNAECIVIYWRERDGSLCRRVTAYEERPRTDPMRQGRKTTSYRIKDDAGQDSLWVMYRLILGPWDSNQKQFSKEKVFWLWRKGKNTSAVFQEKGALDIQKTFFGGDEKLYALWSQIKVPKYFRYEFAPTSGVSDELGGWLKNNYYVGNCWSVVKEDVVKFGMKDGNEDLQRMQKRLENFDNEKAVCDEKRKKASEDLRNAVSKNEEMKQIKGDKKGFGVNTKMGKWEEIVKILRQYFDPKMEFKPANFTTYIQKVKSKTECKCRYGHNRKQLEKKKKGREDDLKQRETVLKNMVFSVSVSIEEETGIREKQEVGSDNKNSDGSDF